MEIPQEQLDRITPTVNAARASLSQLVQELPFDAESALTFHPEGEGEQ